MTLSLLTALALSPSIAQAAPATVPHQGRLLDANGDPLTGLHTLTLSLYDGNDAVFWSEELTDVLFDAGYYSISLGENTPLDLIAYDSVSLGISVDQGNELLPKQQLGSAPFALVATNLKGGQVDANHLKIGGEVVIDEQGLYLNGVEWDQITNPPETASLTTPLNGVSCNADELLVFSGSDWVCSAISNHTHDATALNSGVISADRLKFGGASTDIAPGDHSHSLGSLGAVNTTDFTAHQSNVAAHHTQYTDANAQSALTPHTSSASAHHTKYTNANAVAALGTHTTDPAAHHAKYTDANANAAVDVNGPIAAHAATPAAHHAKYTDANANAAVDVNGPIAAHAATPAAHHAKYTDANAVTAIEGAPSLVLSGNLTVNGTINQTNKPWFMASGTAGWTYCPVGQQWHDIVLDKIQAGNADGSYSTATGKFTAPQAGLYLCQDNLYNHRTGSVMTGYIHHSFFCTGSVGTSCGISNSSATYDLFGYNNLVASTGTLNSYGVTAFVFLGQGDTIGPKTYCSVTNMAIYYGAHSRFSCALISGQ